MTQNTNQTPRRYWRSLDELQETPEFVEFLHREFPVAASEFPQGVSRRRWLQLMGASLAMGGAIGCRYPEETIAPFVIRPENRVPGERYARATNFELADRVHHLLVSCLDGRPLKIEGNPDHPATGGGTDAYVQASILSLYDPDRAASVQRREGTRRRESDWATFDAYARDLVDSLGQSGGRLAVLMTPTRSPSLVRMVSELRDQLPETAVCVYDSVHGDALARGVQAATGEAARPVYRLDQADVILSLEADILGAHPNFLQNVRGFAQGRNPTEGTMNRLYVVESGFSTTGMSGDSRLSLPPSQMVPFLAALERRINDRIGEGGAAAAADGNDTPYDQLEPAARVERFLDVLAQDLVDARGRSAVVVGDGLGEAAVAASVRINSTLENLGATVQFVPAVDSELGELVSLEDLVGQIQQGQVDALLILGGNPVFTAPADVPLASAISNVADSIYLGEYDDETAVLCRWALPQAHPLESWGDCVGDLGHYGICQPHILPLLGGRTAIEVIAGMIGANELAGEAIVRRTADAIGGASLSDRQWRTLLHNGFDESLVVSPIDATYTGSADALTDAEVQLPETVDNDAIELAFVPADGLYDGRFANNGWLQELPQSLTKLTWDNAAVMNPKTARALGVRHGVMVALTRGSATLELPVFEVPGIALGVIVVPYGYGRTRAGAVGGMVEAEVAPVGFDVAPLRASGAMAYATGIKARPRPLSEYTLATTQNHWAIDDLGREEAEDRSYQLVREGTKELFDKLPDFAQYMGVHSPDTGSLWEEPINVIEKQEPDLPQWGMSIDLSKCFSCNACVVACQSENNVPIVGKEQVLMGREMHWLRIDRYFQGDEDHADVVQEPMLCQHCETAPCEQVCPVAATLHTDDGINAMVYNRCIGTRYCGNNCPYKVRRFNYFNWNKDIGVGYGIDAFRDTIENANRQLQQLVLNPNVTVRGRGVMEKCTFCIQRVQEVKIRAGREGGRPIEDGEVQTACQTACPTKAIEFGNIADRQAEVTRLRHDPRSYALLDQLNTSPRNTYMARISNPHVRLMTARQLEDLVTWPEKAAQHHAAHAAHGDDHGSTHGDHEYNPEEQGDQAEGMGTHR